MKSPKVAVFIHAFHLEVMREIDVYIDNIPYDYDLYINFTRNQQCGHAHLQSITRLIEYYKRKKGDSFYYLISPNKGMDPGGFIVSANQALNHKKEYDYICKIHTKTGKHNNNPFEVTGSQWRKDLLDTLLGSPTRIHEIINIFENKKKVGMISCVDYLCQDMSSNLKQYKQLCKKYKILQFAKYPQSKSFFAGTMFWVRGDILNFFKKNNCDLDIFERISDEGPLSDGTMAHAFERFFSAIIRNMKYELFPLPAQRIATRVPKIISFYFPQYHNSPLNNVLWGEGFTEWVNLKKAKSKVRHQKFLHPHPSLGYYDLENKKTRSQQAKLAREGGISGFAYHHYWFGGKKALYKPLEELLKDGEPNLPFCLNWANEPWTKNWDGQNDKVLVPQDYGGVKEWDAHFSYLCHFFRHKNYIKIDNKPVLLIYRAPHIKVFPQMREWWETRAKERGWNGLYIIQCLGNFDNRIFTGTNAVCEFQPNFSSNQGDHKVLYHKSNSHTVFDKETCYDIVTRAKGKQKSAIKLVSNAHAIRDWTFGEKVRKAGISYYNGFFPGWDNTPRREKSEAIIFSECSSETYRLYLMKQLYNTLEEVKDTNDEGLLFMNSWNEWGEGCLLEPSRQKNHQTLVDTKEALRDICDYYLEKKDNEQQQSYPHL